MIDRALEDRLDPMKQVVTLLIRSIVRQNDPELTLPTKVIGRDYHKNEVRSFGLAVFFLSLAHRPGGKWEILFLTIGVYVGFVFVDFHKGGEDDGERRNDADGC